MISPQTQFNLKNAKEYFRDHLSLGDYYAQEKMIPGEWMGAGAARLNLRGNVGESAFLALCDGNRPDTGEKLTLRRNSVRHANGRLEANRRVFYDFTFSPPKSFSVVALMRDKRLVDLHANAVRTALRELEGFAETRVRINQDDGARPTGNLVAACFGHDTSRELDPHLHTHCVVFNATFDPVEERWKALHNGAMLCARRYVEQVYDAELCSGLAKLGYHVNYNARSFEIQGVPAATIDRFSKRHKQIDAETVKRLEASGAVTNVNAIREQIAHDQRSRKIKNATAETLRAGWEQQLTPDEVRRLAVTNSRLPIVRVANDEHRLIQFAHDSLFERRSVLREDELLATALERGRGQEVNVGALKAEIEKREYLRKKDSRDLTCIETLRSESFVVGAAREGRGMRHPLVSNYTCEATTLSMEQRDAVVRILRSRDFVTLFRGGAGTGKSFTLAEAVRALTSAQHPVVVLAPQRQQVEGLERDGMKAQTLAAFLASGSFPAGGVVVLDEAGQVGIRQMATLTQMARAVRGRLLLSGDTRQHGAVEASDAMVLFEKYAKFKAVELTVIRRQDPRLAKSREGKRFIAGYRKAVKAAATGNVQDSFDRLDRMGCIVEVSTDNRYAPAVEEYVRSVDAGANTLLISQTRAEVEAVNEAVRAGLAGAGKLGDSVAVRSYKAVDLTEAAKTAPLNYRPGDYLSFSKRYGRFAKGDLVQVIGSDEKGVSVSKDGRRSRASFAYASRFIIVQERMLDLAPGDRLQMKANAKSQEGLNIINGELVTVRRVLKSGAVMVQDAKGSMKTIAPAQCLFNRGYAVTSYGSQGKTVDTILFVDSGSRAATDRKQWYVAISRGRSNVKVFTPDKRQLRASILSRGDRPLAVEVKPPEFPFGASAHYHMSQLGYARIRQLQTMRPQAPAQMFRR